MQTANGIISNPEKSTISPDELAVELGIGRVLVYRKLADGSIPSIRLGKRFIIPRATISAWLQSAGQRGVNGANIVA